MAPEREALAGLVERVTFHSPETGFCVLRVKVRGQRELVALVGAAASITAGEFVQASGSWVNDRTHGLQFKTTLARRALGPKGEAARGRQQEASAADGRSRNVRAGKIANPGRGGDALSRSEAAALSCAGSQTGSRFSAHSPRAPGLRR